MSEHIEPIRVGIIGLGRSGWNIHADAIKMMPDRYQLVAVTDAIESRATESAASAGVRHAPTVEALLTDPDVELVVVASFNRFHAEHAIAALNAGKHVLCEKPFGLTTVDVDAMIAASEKAGRVLQPFQQRRFEPDFEKLRDVIASGVLGNIEFVRICWHGFKRRWDWQTDKSTGGGTMNNNGPHLIDHAMELFGEEQEPEVWADMRHGLCSGDAEDHLKIILKGEGRPTIEIELSDLFAYPAERWLVCGTRGGLHGTANRLDWKWVDWSTMPERPLQLTPTPDRSYNSEPLAWNTDSWQPEVSTDGGAGAAPATGPTFRLYTDLFNTIRHGAPQTITPQSVRRRVLVMEKARVVGGYY